MADRSEQSWWRKTKLLAVTAIASGGLASLVAMLLAPTLARSNTAGIPSGQLITTLLAPFFVLLVIFWAAERQRRIDRTHGFYES